MLTGLLIASRLEERHLHFVVLWNQSTHLKHDKGVIEAAHERVITVITYIFRILIPTMDVDGKSWIAENFQRLETMNENSSTGCYTHSRWSITGWSVLTNLFQEYYPLPSPPPDILLRHWAHNCRPLGELITCWGLSIPTDDGDSDTSLFWETASSYNCLKFIAVEGSRKEEKGS